ncbi:MAG: DciA family protein [Candidatus Thiodiazotropha sp.]|jgi:hypothetical protein
MQSVRKIITGRATPAQLGKQLSEYAALCQQVRKCLTPPLDQQLKATVLQGRTLSLFCESPVWASRFRYAIPQLQRQLAGCGLVVKQIRTRILLSNSAKPVKKSHKHLSLSCQSSEALRQAAAAIEDKGLKEALLRLSRHGGKAGQSKNSSSL